MDNGTSRSAATVRKATYLNVKVVWRTRRNDQTSRTLVAGIDDQVIGC